MSATPTEPWRKTACSICALNCGLEVQLEGSRIVRIRGDKEHPASRGYVCEKSQRIDSYQNGADRLSSPLRRRPDGTHEPIDWDTAIREIAARLQAIVAAHGGETILYYGGGSQGNHLGGTYAQSTLAALGVKYRSNALAQEKTGEGWVQGKMFGAGVHGDFERCEVAVFLGKNPWHSHGFARTRVILREIQKDPARSLIVIDPRRSETAAMADFHLAIRPGTDAWCLAALAAILVQEGLVKESWVAEHTVGYAEVAAELRKVPVARHAAVCGVEESLLRAVARRIAGARSVSMIEDLGLQMNVHSTLSSYLNRLVWLLTGHYARPGTNNAYVPLVPLAQGDKRARSKGGVPEKAAGRQSPVVGARVIMGLIPCNVIPEEILTDHPRRFRAMLIESANPVHSLADSPRMREALRALELSVVIDVAMTETARLADYVLPASSQLEKAEATFFNFEHPRNVFHLRQPLLAPRPGTLPEAEIHARLIEALGHLGERDYAPLRRSARWGRLAFTLHFSWLVARRPRLSRLASVLLYRTLGPTLPAGMAPAASLWGLSQIFVRRHRGAARRAGFGGPVPAAGNRLFDAILQSPSGLVFAVSGDGDSWRAVGLPGHRVNLHLPELLPEVARLDEKGPPRDAELPFILSAGERRSETSNTSIRDTSWHRAGSFDSTLRIHPQDAEALGCRDGDRVRVSTRRGSGEAVVEITSTLQPGHVSLPNGHGLDTARTDGTLERRGIAVNELTDGALRDAFAGTPWHKHVPARLERIGP